MAFKRFEDILAWQHARTLVSEIYGVTSTVDRLRRDIRLTDRMQEASVAIMSNIAKGFATQNAVKFAEHLRESLGSAMELQSLLYIAADLERIDRRTFDRLHQMTKICERMLLELINLISRKVNQRSGHTPAPRRVVRPRPPTSRAQVNAIQQQPTAPHVPVQTPASAYEPQPPTQPAPPGNAPNDTTSTGELERPDIAPVYDHEDLIHPPEWPRPK